MQRGTREAMVLSEVLRNNACMIDHYNMYMQNCQDQQLRNILERQQRHTLDSFQKLMQIMQNHGLNIDKIPQPSTLNMRVGTQTSPNAQYYGTERSSPQYGGTRQHTETGAYGAQYNIQQSAVPGAEVQTGGQEQVQRAGAINDKVIAEGALIFHKCSADTNTRAALESAEPHIRNALTNMARNCIEMSYEIYNYMTQRGWYQLPAPPRNYISHSPTQQQHPPQ